MTQIAVTHLEAYQRAAELLAAIDAIADALPLDEHRLAEELRRAALQLPLRVAELVGWSPSVAGAAPLAEARVALSTCRGALAVVESLGTVEPWRLARARQLAGRTAGLLATLAMRDGCGGVNREVWAVKL